MKFFAGIVPPPDIYREISAIQNQFGDNRLEPHITIRPPVDLLNADVWVKTLAAVTTAFTPFQIWLTGTDYFGKGVLYIKADSKPLYRLHRQLIPALAVVEPEAAKRDQGQYHPHLTLGRAWCGFTPGAFTQMQQLANHYLTTNEVGFEVTHIRVYHKPDNSGRFKTYCDLPLGN